MGVYIKGMKMPEGCPFCPLSHWTSGTNEFAGCNIVPSKRYAMLNDIAFAASLAKSRPDWCPLGEVPEQHGRLGDLDRMEQMFADIDDAPYSGFDGTEPFYSAEDAAQIIRLAPTIIEAEE